MGELSVSSIDGKLLLEIFKAPYLCHIEAGKQAAKRQKDVSGKGIQPVIDVVVCYSMYIQEWKLDIAQNSKPKGYDDTACKDDEGGDRR